MKTIYCLMIVLCPWPSMAQEKARLSIGDEMPDIKISNVYNYPDSVIKPSVFKGQLTILDFWATWCGACVATFPAMQALKKQFGPTVKFLFVDNAARDTKINVNSFFEKRKIRTGEAFTFPYVLGDTILYKFFPYQTIPHCIWLDSNMQVMAITGHEEVNSANIEKYLSGQYVYLPYKNDAKLFNRNVPLLVNGNGGEPGKFIYRSIITGYKQDLGSSGGKFQNDDESISRMYVINYPLYAIFQMAYPDVLRFGRRRTFIEVKDTALFSSTNDSAYPKRNLFCYEIITPPVSQHRINEYLQKDLERTFNAVAHTETRSLGCYVLTVNSSISNVITSGGPATQDMDEESIHKFIRNTPLNNLLLILNSVLDKPVVNESAFTKNIDIVFPPDIYSETPEQIIKFLFKQGFTVTTANRDMEVAVISQSNNQ